LTDATFILISARWFGNILTSSRANIGGRFVSIRSNKIAHYGGSFVPVIINNLIAPTIINYWLLNAQRIQEVRSVDIIILGRVGSKGAVSDSE
jgi:hypothetical protein